MTSRRGPGRATQWVVAVGAAAVLAAAGCGRGDDDDTPATLSPHEERTFVGIVAEDVFSGASDYRARALAHQRAVGVRLIRQTFDWSQIERSPLRYDFSSLDEYVAAVSRRGMELLPILFNPPPFRSSRPARGAKRGTYPPKDSGDIAPFGAALVRRYGPQGTFWDERPRLPRRPIHAWQVWNEPSLPVYWPPEPDARAYARLLRAAARGIKGVDPHAEIVSAGLAESRFGVPFDDFVRKMYEAGAGSALDTFALHAFARDSAGVLAAVEHARGLLARLGDRPPIWVTELGFASEGPPSPFTAGERGQAERIEQTMGELIERRRELGVRGVVYYAWRDAAPYPGGRDFWGLHTGLLREDGTSKPALRAFHGAAGRLR